MIRILIYNFFIIASKTFLMQYAATFFPGAKGCNGSGGARAPKGRGVVYEIAQMQQRKRARAPAIKEQKHCSEKAREYQKRLQGKSVSASAKRRA